MADPATPWRALRCLTVRAQFLGRERHRRRRRVSVSRAPPTDQLRGRVSGRDRLALLGLDDLGGLAQRHHVGGLVGGPQRVGRHQRADDREADGRP